MWLEGAAAALLAASSSADSVRERTAEILRGGGYQTELPRGPPRPTTLDLGPLEILLRVLFWTALAAIGIALVTWLVRRLAGFVPDAEAPAGPAAAEADVGRRQLASAESLAARGRYGEAIHVLLLDTLEALSRAARLAPSLTSREIVERVPLPSRAREALAGLVAAVEVSWFGGAEPGEADYRLCLERFHAFLGTYRSAA
jgi:hypothetical protein